MNNINSFQRLEIVIFILELHSRKSYRTISPDETLTNALPDINTQQGLIASATRLKPWLILLLCSRFFVSRLKKELQQSENETKQTSYQNKLRTKKLTHHCYSISKNLLHSVVSSNFYVQLNVKYSGPPSVNNHKLCTQDYSVAHFNEATEDSQKMHLNINKFLLHMKIG